MNQYLTPTQCIDSENPDIVSLMESLVSEDVTDVANALALYYWVRDNIRYNPYTVDFTLESFLASAVLQAGEGWCVPKAILLAALCRAAGIPTKLGYADVRNHLSTERMRKQMDTDVFYFHGYCTLYLQGAWVKATPAFNIELCEKFGLKPLEFDGLNDSLYHAFDQAGNQHMEYLRDRGEYADLPFEELMSTYREHYPYMFEGEKQAPVASEQWDRDVAKETL